MPQANIYLNEELNKKLEECSDKLKISKNDLIIRILEDYKEKK